MSCVQTIINYLDGMFCFPFQATTPQFTVSFADKKWLRSMLKLTHFYLGLNDGGISPSFRGHNHAEDRDRQEAVGIRAALEILWVQRSKTNPVRMKVNELVSQN